MFSFEPRRVRTNAHCDKYTPSFEQQRPWAHQLTRHEEMLRKREEQLRKSHELQIKRQRMFQKLTEASVKIQKWWRTLQAHVQQKKTKHAAKVITAGLRRFLARKRALAVVTALRTLRDLKCKVECQCQEIQQELKTYTTTTTTTRSEKFFRIHADKLEKCVLSMDLIDTCGSSTVRQQRREVVEIAQQMLQQIDVALEEWKAKQQASRVAALVEDATTAASSEPLAMNDATAATNKPAVTEIVEAPCFISETREDSANDQELRTGTATETEAPRVISEAQDSAKSQEVSAFSINTSSEEDSPSRSSSFDDVSSAAGDTDWEVVDPSASEEGACQPDLIDCQLRFEALRDQLKGLQEWTERLGPSDLLKKIHAMMEVAQRSS